MNISQGALKIEIFFFIAGFAGIDISQTVPAELAGAFSPRFGGFFIRLELIQGEFAAKINYRIKIHRDGIQDIPYPKQ